MNTRSFLKSLMAIPATVVAAKAATFSPDVKPDNRAFRLKFKTLHSAMDDAPKPHFLFWIECPCGLRSPYFTTSKEEEGSCVFPNWRQTDFYGNFSRHTCQSK